MTAKITTSSIQNLIRLIEVALWTIIISTTVYCLMFVRSSGRKKLVAPKNESVTFDDGFTQFVIFDVLF